VCLYVSDDVYAYATYGIALFLPGATRARENIRQNRRSRGAARHSGTAGGCPSVGRRIYRRIFHAQSKRL